MQENKGLGPRAGEEACLRVAWPGRDSERDKQTETLEEGRSWRWKVVQAEETARGKELAELMAKRWKRGKGTSQNKEWLFKYLQFYENLQQCLSFCPPSLPPLLRCG